MEVCTYKWERQYSCLLVKWFSPTQSSSWKTKQAQSQLINKRCLIKPVLFWGSEILHVYFLLLKQQWYIIYYFTAFFKNDADLWWMLCHTIRTNLNLMSRSYTVQICIICNIYNQFFIWLHFLINKALYWLCALWVVWFSKFYSGPTKKKKIIIHKLENLLMHIKPVQSFTTAKYFMSTCNFMLTHPTVGAESSLIF